MKTNVTEERVRRKASVISNYNRKSIQIGDGNYPVFITLFSHESRVTFVLKEVKAKVFWGSSNR